MTTDELWRLLAEATLGPWTIYDNLAHPAEWWIASCGMGEGRATVWSVNPPTPEDAPGHRTDDGGAADERNAALIAAAVNVLPAHLDVIEAARAVSDPMTRDGGGDRWWEAHDALRDALDRLDGAK